MSRRTGIAVAGVLTAVTLAILVLSRSAPDPYDRPPLDPRGTAPGGTRALVELLRAEGAEVVTGGRPRDEDDVVLQLRDTWSGRPAEDLAHWTADGGTLVVTDPSAALAADTGGQFSAGGVDSPGACEIDALAPAERLDPGLPPQFLPSEESSSCFIAGSGAGIDLRRHGAGMVASVASPDPFLNGTIDRADNAVLAVALLVPFRGVRVRVLDPNRFIADDEVGDGTILGALPPRGSDFVRQLVVAFLAWGLIRGRRLGRPVTEELPVPLPASDLVLATGRLLDRNGDVGDAAERLRRRARRDIGVAVGLGADPHPVELADLLTSRTGADAQLVTAALLTPVTDESGLVATSTHLDRLRRHLHDE